MPPRLLLYIRRCTCILVFACTGLLWILIAVANSPDLPEAHRVDGRRSVLFAANLIQDSDGKIQSRPSEYGASSQNLTSVKSTGIERNSRGEIKLQSSNNEITGASSITPQTLTSAKSASRVNQIRSEIKSNSSNSVAKNVGGITPHTLKSPTSATTPSTLKSSSAGVVTNKAVVRYCVDDVFWPKELDQKIKPPFSKEFGEDFVSRARSLRVVSLKSGCGRTSPQNRLAVLSDGTRVCCRYPKATGADTRAEVYSYHLNGLLGLWNIPPAVAVVVNASSEQWSAVKTEVINAKWEDGKYVVMSLFINDLEEVPFPRPVKHNNTLTFSGLDRFQLTPSERDILIQWTDMIVFDFLVGHTDRLVDTLRLLIKTNLLERPVHNLYKIHSSMLVFIDHESPFSYGYCGYFRNREYYNYQTRFFNATCLFRESTVMAILNLNQTDGSYPIDVLENYIQRVDPVSFNAVFSAKYKQTFQMRKEMTARVNDIAKRLRECSC